MNTYFGGFVSGFCVAWVFGPLFGIFVGWLQPVHSEAVKMERTSCQPTVNGYKACEDIVEIKKMRLVKE